MSEPPNVGTSEHPAMRRIGDYLAKFNETAHDPKHRPIPTGNKAIDDALHGGLGRGKLYTIAAPPSYGKTAFALQLAFDIAKQGQPVLYVALESTMREYISRVASRYIYTEYERVVPYGDLENGVTDIPSEVVAAFETKQYPLFPICRNDLENEVHSVDVDEIVKQYSQLATDCGTAPVLVLDYLQKLDASENDPKQDAPRIKAHLSVLDSISKRYDVPVVILSAVNRGNGYGERKDLENLAGSSRIEYDVDVALFLEYQCVVDGDSERITTESEKDVRNMVLWSPKTRAIGHFSVPLAYRCAVGDFTVRDTLQPARKGLGSINTKNH